MPELHAAVVSLAFSIQDGLESRAQAGPGLEGENQGRIGQIEFLSRGRLASGAITFRAMVLESLAGSRLARASIRTW